MEVWFYHHSIQNYIYYLCTKFHDPIPLGPRVIRLFVTHFHIFHYLLLSTTLSLPYGFLGWIHVSDCVKTFVNLPLGKSLNGHRVWRRWSSNDQSIGDQLIRKRKSKCAHTLISLYKNTFFFAQPQRSYFSKSFRLKCS